MRKSTKLERMNPTKYLQRREKKSKQHVKKRLITENLEFFEKASSPLKILQSKSKKQPKERITSKKMLERRSRYKGKFQKQMKQQKINYSTSKKDEVQSCTDDPQNAPSLRLLEPTLVERRKESINKKLMTFQEPHFSELEENEINSRADLYAVTCPPDSTYYILPENVDDQNSLSSTGPGKKSSQTEHLKDRHKRKRRSYNNIDCFVTHTRKDEHGLPSGTKLLKPPKKLVELVAEAVDRSPDGLLQVQQIYTVLQNKFPYFRYMDKLAISSWRSSIRHALYQKWFRKIRFSSEAISSRGCFWSINQCLNPSEWIVPCHPEAASLWKTYHKRAAKPFLDLLQDANMENEDHFRDMIQIAQEYGISFPECVAEAKSEMYSVEKLNIPSPVRDPDPILVACVPDTSTYTPKAKCKKLEVDDEFDLAFCLTPVKMCRVSCSNYNDSLLSWVSPSYEELPCLFSPSRIYPYGMPVFPDSQKLD